MYAQYDARHATVRAMEVIPIVAGKPAAEHQFVVDGIGVLDAATFNTLYLPHANGNGTKPARRKYTQRTGTKPAVVETKPAQPETHEFGPTTEKILAALKDGPATSGDIVKRTGMTSPPFIRPLAFSAAEASSCLPKTTWMASARTGW